MSDSPVEFVEMERGGRFGLGLASSTLKAPAPLPRPLSGHGCTLLSNLTVLISGGTSSQREAATAESAVLDLKTNTWRQVGHIRLFSSFFYLSLNESLLRACV